ILYDFPVDTPMAATVSTCWCRPKSHRYFIEVTILGLRDKGDGGFQLRIAADLCGFRIERPFDIRCHSGMLERFAFPGHVIRYRNCQKVSMTHRKTRESEQRPSRSCTDEFCQAVFGGEASHNLRSADGVLVDKHHDLPVIRSLFSSFGHDNNRFV